MKQQKENKEMLAARVPSVMKRAAEAQAKAEGRTLSSWVVWVLRQYMLANPIKRGAK